MSEIPARDIQILPATDSDYEDVMAISGGIYKGTDYLPIRYHMWLKDPQRKMFVARSEGKVVAFDSFVLVDGGFTAVMQGLRVAPWIRGCGVAGIIQRKCIDTLRSNHPNVTKVRLTRAQDPSPSIKSKYHLVHSKAVVSLILRNDQLTDAIMLLEQKVNKLEGKDLLLH
ncbi:hypothetical protein GDO86_020631 [Hymenochirus boettgeri]|uniref:N-acetyltransferase domain-containing protein n=1 Tax=Hymenochirus boettgeri TaxID=247094 RepID=A0A8T2IJ12_9PIPI|nr:hypothetical protein GDO86_020631 [Hymenochirus boettgeri]